MSELVWWHCECNTFTCKIRLQIPVTTAKWLIQNNCLLITKMCPHGPEATDHIVDENGEYFICRTAS